MLPVLRFTVSAYLFDIFNRSHALAQFLWLSIKYNHKIYNIELLPTMSCNMIKKKYKFSPACQADVQFNLSCLLFTLYDRPNRIFWIGYCVTKVRFETKITYHDASPCLLCDLFQYFSLWFVVGANVYVHQLRWNIAFCCQLCVIKWLIVKYNKQQTFCQWQDDLYIKWFIFKLYFTW